MKVYVAVAAEGHEHTMFATEGNLMPELNAALATPTPLINWVPPSVRVVESGSLHKLNHSDAPAMGSQALVFGEQAIKILGPLLRDYGELLPLACKQRPLWVYHVMAVVDALDQNKTDFSRVGKEERKISVKKHAFIPETIGESGIFRIPEFPFFPRVYLTDRFVEIWKNSGLKGLQFSQVWDG